MCRCVDVCVCVCVFVYMRPAWDCLCDETSSNVCCWHDDSILCDTTVRDAWVHARVCVCLREVCDLWPLRGTCPVSGSIVIMIISAVSVFTSAVDHSKFPALIQDVGFFIYLFIFYQP